MLIPIVLKYFRYNLCPHLRAVAGFKPLCSAPFNGNGDEIYYVIVNGKAPGLYTKETWELCQKKVEDFSKSDFKKFRQKLDVLTYLERAIIHKSQIVRVKDITHDHTLRALKTCLNINSRKWKQDVGSKRELCNIFKTSNGFYFDEDGYVIVFTDSSCVREAYGGLGVYFGDGNPLNQAVPVTSECNNNHLEMQAVILGLQKAIEAGHRRVKVFTDSLHIVYQMMGGKEKHKANNWKRHNGTAINSKDYILTIEDLCQSLDVKWVYIKSHSGIVGNEVADLLAKKGKNDAMKLLQYCWANRKVKN